MKLHFSPASYRDLQRLYSFFQEENPDTLQKAAERLKTSFTLIGTHPYLGYELEELPGCRELIVPFGKGNYVIRYQIVNETVQVLHLWHSREERD